MKNKHDMRGKPTLIAYYLPQFYELEINNKFMGKGFTEWTQTANAKPLFKDHYQPHIPSDLGFYNLLMPEAREAQANLAREYGIDGFCYWHYWFGNGRVVMEKPLNAVIESGKPDFPFCICWANHTWRNPSTKQLIIEQEYPGKEDDYAHFLSLLPAFNDNRYFRIDGKPLFGLFAPELIPDLDRFIQSWNRYAKDSGLSGLYFVGIAQTKEAFNKIENSNLDAINTVRLKDFLSYQNSNSYLDYIKCKCGLNKKINNYNYSDALEYFISEEDSSEEVIPTIIPGWDHSPRYGKEGLILTGYTPEAFERHVRTTLDVVSKKQNKLCFIKAWNEWGEGNHLEPDLKWGRAFLEVLKRVKEEY